MRGPAEWAGSWRLALRMGARDARRNKARSLLVAVMVGLPVLAGAAIDVAGRSAQLDPQDVATVALGDRAAAFVAMGDGTPLVQTPDAGMSASVGRPTDAETMRNRRTVAASLPPSRQVPYRIDNGRPILVGDRALTADLVELDYDDPGVAGWVTQVAGRAPAAAGEVAVSQDLVRQSDVQIGDTVGIEGLPHADGTAPAATRPVRVVGVVRGPGLLGHARVIGRSGSLVQPRRGNDMPDDGWFIDGPPVSWQQVRGLNAVGARVVSRAVLADPPPLPASLATIPAGPDVDPTLAGIVGVAAVLVLLQITLLAGPALAVGARRNQRTLAVVAGAGGSPAVLRRAVLASGIVVGLATSLVCAVLGVATVAVARGWLEGLATSPMPRVDVHLLDLLLVVAVGTGTALAAAVVPAIQAGRQDVVAALAGRRGQAAPRAWVAVVGVALVGAGLATALVAAYQRSPFLVAVGLALGEFGLVALSGPLVVLASRVAPRLPLASRLALRDAARQRGRTAPAVAAVLAVVAGCAAVAVYTAALDRHDQLQYTPRAAHGAVYAYTSDGKVPAEVTAAIRATMPVSQVVPVHTILEEGSFVEVGRRAGGAAPGPVVDGPGILVDDGTAVSLLVDGDASQVRAALAAGRVAVFRPDELFPDGTVHLRVLRDGASSKPRGTRRPPPDMVALPATYVRLPVSLGRPVLPASAVARLGPEVGTGVPMVLAATTRMPTAAEEQRLVARLGSGAAGVERGYRSPYPVFLLVIAIASVVVALGSTLAVVGLSAAEGRADVATLAAVGAAPRVRRRLAAAQAGVVAVLGTGLAASAAWSRGSRSYSSAGAG